MSRRIILHIGPPKTGTSSLQETLFAAQDELMTQGMAYPTLGRHDRMPRAAGHHGLPAVTQFGAPLPAPLLEWIGDLPAGHSVVLSSEDFSHLSAEQVAHLAAQLPGAAVEVVYYARRWDRLLPSVWQELVKHGASCSYPVYANLQTAAPGPVSTSTMRRFWTAGSRVLVWRPSACFPLTMRSWKRATLSPISAARSWGM